MARKKALALSTKYRRAREEINRLKLTLAERNLRIANLINKADWATYSVRVLRRALAEAERREDPMFLQAEVARIITYLNVVEPLENKNA